MNSRTLGILLAAGAVVALASAFLWTVPLDAWNSVCDNCMDGENQWGEPDAQCCLDGWQCEMLEDNGYSYALTNLEWCTTTVTESGVQCNGQSGCSADGDGGGGGSCHIPYGELCPAECMSCTYFYY